MHTLFVHGNAQLLARATGKLAGHLHTVLHRHSLGFDRIRKAYADRNEGAHIAGSHTRVLSVVLGHVDQLISDTASVQCSLNHRLLVTHERIHGSVGRSARIHIQNRAAR